jgi:DNA-binding MarR family transcriptional regulator
MTQDSSIMPKIGIIFLTWQRYLQKRLVPHNITLKQYYILKKLSKEDFIAPSEIANVLFCDRPTASVIIKNMERQGWITRERDAANAKQVKVLITTSGLNKLKQLDESGVFTNMIQPLACFNPEETEKLASLLTMLRRNLDEQIK